MTSILAVAALSASLALSEGHVHPSAPTAVPAPAIQIQQSAGHYHEGELGEKYLLIEHALKCDCSCSQDVHTCQFQMQCPTSPGWSSRIRAALEAGQTPEAIEASFVAEFGPAVLMLPPPEGFNLVGYFLPALAIVTAGMLVGLVIRRGGGRPDLAPAPARGVSEEERDLLTEELRRLEESQSPDW